MATSLKNLSSTDLKAAPGLPGSLRIGVVVAEWNAGITSSLLAGALGFLTEKGVEEKQIRVCKVPGSFELPLGAQLLAGKQDIDAVIALGCVIRGETPHFDFICDACAHGIMQVGLRFNKPVAFGVLTTDNEQQALDRAGGKHGNKGVEAAETALKMLLLQHE